MYRGGSLSTGWYAVRVRSNYEWRTASYLEALGLPVFLPAYKTRKRYSDRMKEVEAPLFPGYVFCRSEEGNWLPILQAVGVVGVVGIGNRPIPVDEDEIEAIRIAVNTGRDIEPWPYSNVGKVFKISHGAMEGLEGILVRVKDRNRIVLSVNLLQRSVAVEIDPNYVAVVRGRRQEVVRKLAS